MIVEFLLLYCFLDLCPDCREGLLCQQQRDLREYTQATIYVHKVVDNKKVMKDSAPELNVSSSETEEDKEEAKPDGEKDPDFNQSNGSTKRQKTSQQGYVSYQKQVIRRSTRHRKVRGEKALLVSANQTLKELKIQVRECLLVCFCLKSQGLCGFLPMPVLCSYLFPGAEL